jgi:DNA-binding MarR family transcriptional regulator
MALKGKLQDFSVPQLLNLINLARKTGSLSVYGSERKALLYFRDGTLAYSRFGNQDNGLASILHRANKISSSQFKIIKTRAGDISDKELGLLLINANYLSQEEIINCLQSEFIRIAQQIFTWLDGVFQFEKDILPPDDKIALRINLENIIIEGSRKLREWEHLKDEIPSLDMALTFKSRPGVNVRSLNLSTKEWKVINYINPRNSIRQIARATNTNDNEIRRIVYSLIQAGLIEMVRPEGVEPPKRLETSLPVSDKEEQKSLIQRIIKRIRSL